jgi:hypothetical protein
MKTSEHFNGNDSDDDEICMLKVKDEIAPLTSAIAQSSRQLSALFYANVPSPSFNIFFFGAVIEKFPSFILNTDANLKF